MRNMLFLLISIFSFSCQNTQTAKTAEVKTDQDSDSIQNIHSDFVHLDDVIKGIKIDPRYFSHNNFTGTKVDKYKNGRLLLVKEAADSLGKVQNALKAMNLELKVFDAYRPQGAVDHFVRWAKDLNDTLMKSQYYPDVPKSQLFEKGYIAAKSGHSRGSTIDLTIIESATGKELDMGTPWDFFSPHSWPSDTTVTQKQYENRMLLQGIMEKHGFKHLKEEWWHFTLKNEPYPETYFTFEVQ